MKFTVLEGKAVARWQDFFVAAIPRSLLKWKPGETVAFYVQILEGGLGRERYPERGLIEFPSPTPDFAASQWFV